MKAWTIRNLKASPSMEQHIISFTGTYQEAIAEVRRVYHETGRSTSLHSDAHDTYYWFRLPLHETDYPNEPEVFTMDQWRSDNSENKA